MIKESVFPQALGALFPSTLAAIQSLPPFNQLPIAICSCLCSSQGLNLLPSGLSLSLTYQLNLGSHSGTLLGLGFSLLGLG